MRLKRLLILLLLLIPSHVAIAGPDAAPMSGDQALMKLMEGNKRFVEDKAAHPNRDSARKMQVAEGQNPFALVLGCADSRVPAEVIFDQGLGDIFVTRVAGNILDKAVLGSIEYGVGVLKIPLVMVLGHEECGAVKAALKNDPLPGDIDWIAGQIRNDIRGNTCDPKNPLPCATKLNVKVLVEQLKRSDPVIAPLVKNGSVKIVGAFYNLKNGSVEPVE